jgi:hypothetical protein
MILLGWVLQVLPLRAEIRSSNSSLVAIKEK